MLSVTLWGIAGVLTLASLLPLLKIPFGALRGLAFPREQFFGVAVFLTLAFILADVPFGGLGALLMGIVAAFQFGYIVPFTPIWRKQSRAAEDALLAQPERRISILSANVKLSNREYDRLIDLVRARDIDVLLAIEVDADWIAALKQGLEQDLPNAVDVPLDTGYGMSLMSRLPVANAEVREIITEGVPSIRAEIELNCGERVALYVVHPEPPVIDHDTIGRDSEIAMIGLEAADDPLPAIVSGDLNDVAWSTTTRRFQRVSKLLDPRIGRGFFNTFSATHPWMRWPLDHLFHDARFRLIEMARLEKIGSDHFPMLFRLALFKAEAIGVPTGEAEVAEINEIERTAEWERRRPRDPIGADWEKELDER